MRRIYNVVLYCLALIPLLFIVSVLFVFRDYDYATIRRIFAVVMTAYALTLILLVLDTRTNKHVPDAKRLLWGALIIVGSSVAHLVYLWLYVMPGQPRSSHP